MSEQRDKHDRLSGPMRAALERSMLTPSGECPDAETLAAYFDRTLTRRQQDDCTQHVSTCDRCQAVLAAVAQIDDTPVGVRKGAWPAYARWRWLVPATATAAALAVWLVVERRDPGPPVDQVQMAARDRTEPTSDARQEEADRPESASPSPAAPPALLAGDADSTAQRKQVNETARIAEGTLRKDEPFLAQPIAAPPPAEAAAAPAASSESRREVARNSSATSVAERPTADLLEVSALPPSVEVRSPDPKVRWRISRFGIQRSTDEGASWSPQHVQSGSALIAGSSPSAAVCWVGGEGGIVLRTVDGTTWERLTAPSFEDVVAIVAVSGTDATVTTRSGQQFVTSDGGRSWRRA